MEWNCHGDEESGRHKECANVLKSKGYRQVLAIAIDVFAYKEKANSVADVKQNETMIFSQARLCFVSDAAHGVSCAPPISRSVVDGTGSCGREDVIAERLGKMGWVRMILVLSKVRKLDVQLPNLML
ncbi:hypothetical protein NL676_029231 [Syzygium grande]|nr:hypothetical protein NL676_029231 [Syzygium grande]